MFQYKIPLDLAQTIRHMALLEVHYGLWIIKLIVKLEKNDR